MTSRGYCRNCTVRVKWGVYCNDCVRAWSIGVAGAIGAGLGAWLLKWITQ